MKQQIFNALFAWWLKGKSADKIAHIILTTLAFAIGVWIFNLEFFTGIIGLKEACAFSLVFVAIPLAAYVEYLDNNDFKKGKRSTGGDVLDFIHSIIVPMFLVLAAHVLADQGIIV